MSETLESLDSPGGEPQGAAVDDLSTLSWVNGELRRSLEAAHKALRRHLKEAEAASGSDVSTVDPAVLRSARAQLHQGVGALDMVGLKPAATVLRASEAAVQRMISRPAMLDAAAVETLEKASFGLLDFLARQLAGKPVPPVMLFPQYRAVQTLAGAERIHPADLWPLAWQWQTLPADPKAQPTAANDSARSAMETLVLGLMRQAPGTAASTGNEALLQMSDLCANLGAGALESSFGGAEVATFWQLAAAVFEAQAQGLLAADTYVKRLASGMLSVLRQRIRGQAELPQRQAHDLLFFCSHAQAPADAQTAPRLAAVRKAWDLDSWPTADYETARLGRHDPAVLALARKRVAQAKDAWSAVAGGEMHRLPGMPDQFQLMGDSLQRLFPAGESLARALQQSVAQTAAGGAEPPPALAMEVATALLYVDASLEDAQFDHPELAERVQRLARRIEDVRIGADPQPLDVWMEELYRRVSDRQTMGSVVQELRASLSEIEKQIDQYFRDPSKRELLIPVPAQMSSMRGVLSVLGMEQASQAALHMRDDVENLAQTEVDPQLAVRAGTFDRLADNLGALSFLIDMLSVQPQLAKSLFRFDPQTGSLSAVMGQSERVSAFAAFDEDPSDRPLQLDLRAGVQPLPPPAPVAAPAAMDMSRFTSETTIALLPSKPRTGDAITLPVLPSMDMPMVLPTAAPVPAPVPTPVPASVAPLLAATPAATTDTGLEDDAEMREIFIEEAREVVGDAQAALERLGEAPDNTGDLTVVRRAFHTLKGSSRMVGLREFGEAAWACEQLYNDRLASAPRMDSTLRGFTGEALQYLSGWTDAIESGDSLGHRAADVAQAADSLRLRGERLPVAAPGGAAGLVDETSAAAPAVPEPLVLETLALPEVPAVPEVPAIPEIPEIEALPEMLEVAEAAPLQPLETLELPSLDGWPDLPPTVAEIAETAEIAEATAREPAAPATEPAEPPVPPVLTLREPSYEDTITLPPPAVQRDEPVDLLTLDFDLQEDAPAEQPAEAEAEPELPLREAPTETLQLRVPGLPSASDLDLGGLAAAQSPVAPVAPAEPLSFDLDLSDLDDSEVTRTEPMPKPLLALDEGLSGLSLDLTDELPASAEPTPAAPAIPEGEAVELGLDELGDLFGTADEAAAAGPMVAESEAEGDADEVLPVAPASEPEAQLEAESEAEPEPAPEPAAEAESDEDEEQIKVIGDLRIGIPLFNIYLNEADELSRRLGTELAEWAVESDKHRVPEAAEIHAHSLAGSSATVGYAGLSALSRALEHALERSRAQGVGRPGEAALFTDVAEEIRRLLHQFAAGFLREVPPELMQRLADHERWPVEPAAEPASEAEDETELLTEAEERAALDTELFPIFEEEADELLPQLQTRLSEWLRRPDEADAPMACMRTLHTLKGGARLAGAVRIGEQAHRLETAIEALAERGGATADEIEPLLARADAMSSAFEVLRRGGSAAPAPVSVPTPLQPALPLPPAVQPLVAFSLPVEAVPAPEPEIAEALAPATADAEALAVAAPVERPEPVEETTEPEPAEQAEAAEPSASAETPERPESLVVEPAPADTPEPPAPAPVAPLLTPPVTPPITPPITPTPVRLVQGSAARNTPVLTPAAIDWRRFAATQADSMSAAVPDRAAAASAVVRVRAGLLDRLVNQAGEVSITRARIDADVKQMQTSLGDLTESMERMRRQLRDIELQAETQISTRIEAAKAAAQTFDPLEMDRFTRFQELTRFMAESVNDVATLQRSLQRTLQSTEDELAAQARLTRELQDDLLRTRMIEFDSISERLYRTVRQAAKDTGKQAKVEIVGGAIEVDRGVLERMAGSFEHLLRNCVAHGIEMPEGRVKAAKDASGLITITVAQVGNEVAVEFADDGAGLNLARIRERGVARGLIAADAKPSEAELAGLIFAPGFSTAESVTELAGRGVGLDVVRAEVNAMGGRVETATEAGKGTRFRLLLPLTTAVTQVVMLRCAELQVAVPSPLIELIRRTPTVDVERAYETGTLDYNGEALPFFWLPALLRAGTRGEIAGRSQMVAIVRSAAQRVAIHIDEVVGNQEVVVKNVGPQLSRLPGLAGVTLLPSGTVALIYNPVALAALYGDEARVRQRQADVAAALPQAADNTPRAPLVMVVDDSLTVRRVTQRLLVREGYRVVLAKDGLDALERLAEERPAVLLSDIEMPRMDGFDLVRNLRADARLAALPVVMITSRIAQKHREYAAELGVQHYLGKPYAEEELLALVARYAKAAASA